MMIEKIYIPSRQRSEKQITWQEIPEKWKDKTVILVDKDQEESYSGKGFNLQVLPEEIKGIHKIHEWIVLHSREMGYKKIVELDDDLKFGKISAEGGIIKRYEWTDKWFDDLMDRISHELEESVQGTISAVWMPPRDKDITYATRTFANISYNVETFPVDKLDWERNVAAHDFDITLQLLTQGYKNFCLNWFRVVPTENFGEGGCTDYRTIENHNRDMLALKEHFPDFVNVYEKEQKSGLWKGKKRLACKVFCKKAYEYGLANKYSMSLEEFFK